MERRKVLAKLGGLVSAGGLVVLGSSEFEEPRDPPVDRSPPTATPRTPGEPPDSPGPTPDPSTEPPPTATADPSPYERELDVVEDLGCSPAGDRACEDAIADALEEGVLFRFPEGRYRFDSSLVVRGYRLVGFAGDPEADVRLVPPNGFNSVLLDVADVGHVDFTDIDVDVGAQRTTAGLRFTTQRGFNVENVTYHGRGDHPDDDVAHAFFLAVENPDGEGRLRNVVAKQGSAIGHYKTGDGRAGVWIGPAHHGVAYIEDCEFAEFGNNGLYTSRNPGDVRVEGGVFRNNNVCGVRLSGEGSYVRDATIEVDFESYTGPTTRLNSSFRTRGVVVEQGPFDNDAGVVVENCTIDVGDSPNPGPAIDVWPTGKTVTVTDSTLRTNGDAPVVYRHPAVHQGRHEPASGARWVRLVDVDATGTNSRFPVVYLADASGSLLRNCELAQSGDPRNGVGLLRSPWTLVDGGQIQVEGYPVTIEGSLETPEQCSCLVLFGTQPVVSAGFDSPTVDEVSLSTCQNRPDAIESGHLSGTELRSCLSAATVESNGESDGFVGITDVQTDSVTVRYDRHAE